MAITPADFKVRYPEFDSIADDRINVFLGDAQLEVDENIWDTLYERGVFALAAHMLALGEKSSGGTSGSVGALNKRRIGDVELGFTVYTPDSSSEAYYNGTIYGQDYYRLLLRVGPSVAVCHDDATI